MSRPVVEVNNLQTTFFTKHGPVRVVDNLSYSILKGQTLGIVGESGCGKTVASLSLMRLLDDPGQVTGGSFRLSGSSIFELAETDLKKIRGKKMAMIFQEPMTAMNPVYTVGFQIEEQLIQHLQLSRNDAHAEAIRLLDLVGIPDAKSRYESYPHQLSGGMRQRTMIAMALSCSPEFLIADEPTTALDVTIQAQILDLFCFLQEKFNMTVQFITHDLKVISEIADFVLVMYAGRSCEFASADDLFENPLHPYTQALMESIPQLGQQVSRLRSIEGSVPLPSEIGIGCAFYNRCPKATDLCRTHNPALRELSPQHRVACHYA